MVSPGAPSFLQWPSCLPHSQGRRAPRPGGPREWGTLQLWQPLLRNLKNLKIGVCREKLEFSSRATVQTINWQIHKPCRKTERKEEIKTPLKENRAPKVLRVEFSRSIDPEETVKWASVTLRRQPKSCVQKPPDPHLWRGRPTRTPWPRGFPVQPGLDQLQTQSLLLCLFSQPNHHSFKLPQ